MNVETLGFIGGGRITRIFLQAFRNSSVSFKSISVFEPDNERAGALKGQFPEITLASDQSHTARQQIVFLAVHPPVMMEAIEKIRDDISDDTIVISLAPKLSIAKMTAGLQSDKIVRMIPNATSIINDGFNPVCFHGSFSADDRGELMELFGILGETFETDEAKLEPYAIFSAMLPTYFWFQWQELEHLATETGLSADEARESLKATLEKSVRLFYESGLTTDEVIDLIPVKPIGEHEQGIREMYNTKLIGLFQKIKP